MPRLKKNALLDAVANILETISLGTGTMPVGRGEAPDCDPPYLIVTSGFGGSFSGPFGDIDADSESRIQVAGVGVTDEQANAALDLAREAFTFAALVAEGVPNRKISSVRLDVEGSQIEQRGLPNPSFSHVDQYLVLTTPG